MHRKLIDKQYRKSITDEVKIRKFLNNIADIIKKSITPDPSDDMTYHDIVNKSEQCRAANRGPNAEHTKQAYPSTVSSYHTTNSTRAR